MLWKLYYSYSFIKYFEKYVALSKHQTVIVKVVALDIFKIIRSFAFVITVIHAFYKKTIFCLSLNFLNIMLEIRLRFFLTFISLFSLIVYLIRFDINNRHHFLTYILTCVSNFTTYIGFIIVLIHRITISTLLTTYVQNLRNFVTFKKLYKRPAVLKIAAQALEARDFFHIF